MKVRWPSRSSSSSEDADDPSSHSPRLPPSAGECHRFPSIPIGWCLIVIECHCLVLIAITCFVISHEHAPHPVVGSVPLALSGADLAHAEGAKTIIHGCDLSVGRGQRLILRGPNGAGAPTSRWPSMAAGCPSMPLITIGYLRLAADWQRLALRVHS